MPITSGTVGAKMVSVEGRIIRANRSVEELGVISYWHANPLKRWAWQIGRARKSIVKRLRSALQ